MLQAPPPKCPRCGKPRRWLIRGRCSVICDDGVRCVGKVDAVSAAQILGAAITEESL